MAETDKKALQDAESDSSATEVKAADKKDVKKAASKKNKVSFKEKLSKFFRDYKSEMKKITWYGLKPTINSTLLVLAAIVICSAFISLLDLGFSKALLGLGKLM